MTHHANLIIGPSDWAMQQVPDAYRSETADIHQRSFENFTIKDARKLIDDAYLKSQEGDEQVFVITTQNILREAQNTLLKLFEDPSPQTLFYLIIPEEDLLLPTLRSRLHLLASYVGATEITVFDVFLKLSYAERLKEIEVKTKEKDNEWINQLVLNIVEHARQKKDSQLIKDALMLSNYIKHKGSSKKMLLEHIALSL